LTIFSQEALQNSAKASLGSSVPVKDEIEKVNRRNISPDQRIYLIGKRYKEEKKVVGENQYTIPIERDNKEDTNCIERVANSLPPTSTAEKIAKQSNVSHQTVKNAEKFADAVDKVAENTLIKEE